MTWMSSASVPFTPKWEDKIVIFLSKPVLKIPFGEIRIDFLSMRINYVKCLSCNENNVVFTHNSRKVNTTSSAIYNG